MTQQLDFSRIPPNLLDEEGLICLDKALEVSYYGHTRETVWPLLEMGTFQLWRGLSDKGQFIVLTEINTVINLDKKVLNIWSLGGKGYIRYINLVYQALLRFASEVGCTHISGTTERFGFDKLYSHFPTKNYKLCIMEIPK